MMKGCKLVLRLSGKAEQVFKYLALLAERKGSETIGNIERGEQW